MYPDWLNSFNLAYLIPTPIWPNLVIHAQGTPVFLFYPALSGPPITVNPANLPMSNVQCPPSSPGLQELHYIRSYITFLLLLYKGPRPRASFLTLPDGPDGPDGPVSSKKAIAQSGQLVQQQPCCPCLQSCHFLSVSVSSWQFLSVPKSLHFQVSSSISPSLTLCLSLSTNSFTENVRARPFDPFQTARTIGSSRLVLSPSFHSLVFFFFSPTFAILLFSLLSF